MKPNDFDTTQLFGFESSTSKADADAGGLQLTPETQGIPPEDRDPGDENPEKEMST